MDLIKISSGDLANDFENHFRVFAGPGAGKTHWLVRQIGHVIRNSKRLLPATRIACISYTNVAVKKIREDLGSLAERVEVSTIHSFLYHNVVRPYLHLVKDDNGCPLVDFANVDGHDKHRPAYDKVRSWLESVGASRFFLHKDPHATYAYLKKVVWRLDETAGEWHLKPMVPTKPVKYLPTTKLNSYKLAYWKDGIIDHDDVLYFSYRILDESPLIGEFLSARYPYIFIDEFQDTNPIQTQVVRWLASEGTVVGVIGDPEQSIFQFQGAKPEDFREFQLTGHVDYTIGHNRRSTGRILALLNHMRKDGLKQDKHREIEGDPVHIYVGEIEQMVPAIKETLPQDSELVILTRTNREASRARKLAGSDMSDLWQKFEAIDRDRKILVEALATAGELARNGEHNLALRTLIRGIRVKRQPFKYQGDITEIERRGIALSLLEFLISDYDELREKTLVEIYQLIGDVLGKNLDGLQMTGVHRGKFKDFAQSVVYKDLASTVSMTEDTRTVRTIHKAKSAEFNNVLVYFEDKKRLKHILYPTVNPTEENRITYVACSRAQDRLFIGVPEISEKDAATIENLTLEVVSI